MKANELMIGDWVFNRHHKKNIQITPFDFFTHGHLPSGKQYFLSDPKLVTGRDLEPIPLTEGILEKNGFVLIEDEKGAYGVNVAPYYTRDDVPFEFFCDGEPFAIWFKDPVNIGYVHELQHALRLCGIGKEIVL